MIKLNNLISYFSSKLTGDEYLIKDKKNPTVIRNIKK